jgi:hypothetical protein
MIKDMDNGEFTNCNDHCPFISAMLSDKQESVNFIVPLSKLPSNKKNRPMVINFSYDRSCNLQCPSCRDSLILYKVGENEQLVNIHVGVEKLVDYLLSQDETVVLNITGSGDAFASPTYWQYLKTLSTKNPGNNLKIKLIDLLNEKHEKFGGPYCELVESDQENENLFTIISKIVGGEKKLECEIKPYESKGRTGYPNYVLHLKSDDISEETKGPWSFSEDRLHYVVDFIRDFLFGVRYNK